MVSDVGSVPSVEEMLARSAANVKSGKTTKNMSAVQKLLAENGEPEDTVEISPVQKVLQKQLSDAKKVENYFDSDQFLQLKIGQLRGQLAIYSTLPGLDPSGAVIGGIEAEIKDIIGKQQAKLKASLDKSAEAEKKLKEAEAQKALDAEIPTAQALLDKINGKTTKTALSKEVQALLNKVKGSTVNTSA